MPTDVAVLDMDGTILSKRSIDVLSDRFDLTSRLEQLDLRFKEAPKYVVTQKIAKLLSGTRRADLESTFDSIPLNVGVHELVSFLKDRGFVIALATDSYKFLADRLRDRLQLDLAYANNLGFNGNFLNGEVLTAHGCLKVPGCKQYFICKLRLLKSLQGALRGRTVAIGDSDSDYCMLGRADISIAYKPKSERIRETVDKVVQDFSEAITFLRNRLEV